MVSPKLKDALLKAADEIERRGWIRGDMAETYVPNPKWQTHGHLDARINPYIPVPLDTCRVCAMGGIGAAVFGDPMAGDGAFRPEIMPLLTELADHLMPGWSELHQEEWDGGGIRPRFSRPSHVIATWNDEDVDNGEQVISRFRELAAS